MTTTQRIKFYAALDGHDRLEKQVNEDVAKMATDGFSVSQLTTSTMGAAMVAGVLYDKIIVTEKPNGNGGSYHKGYANAKG